MIENKELGLKVAENKEEAFWELFKETAEKDIASCKHGIIIAINNLKLAKRMIKKFKQ